MLSDDLRTIINDSWTAAKAVNEAEESKLAACSFRVLLSQTTVDSIAQSPAQERANNGPT
jgi:hypothetical protein